MLRKIYPEYTNDMIFKLWKMFDVDFIVFILIFHSMDWVGWNEVRWHHLKHEVGIYNGEKVEILNISFEKKLLFYKICAFFGIYIFLNHVLFLYFVTRYFIFIFSNFLF